MGVELRRSFPGDDTGNVFGLLAITPLFQETCVWNCGAASAPYEQRDSASHTPGFPLMADSGPQALLSIFCASFRSCRLF